MGEKKKRKGKKRRRRLARLLLLCAGILVLLVLLFFVIFQTKNIEVTGSNRYTEDEIRQLVEQQEPLSFNTVLLTFFPVRADFSGVPFLEDISYELISPTTVRAVVDEKTAVGYVEVDGQKAYFDGDGIVLECIPQEEETQGQGTQAEGTQEEVESLDTQPLTEEDQTETQTQEYNPNLEDIPRIEGLNAVSASVGAQLPVSDTAIFETLDALTRLLDRFELWPEQVNVSEEMELTLIYEGNIRILLGGEEYLEEKPRYKANYLHAKKTYTKLKKVLPLLRGEFTAGYDILDDIFDFFGVDSEKEIFETSEKQAALFRTQNKVEVDSINLHAWLRRGELDFKALNLPDYNEKGLMSWIEAREWMKHIEDVDYFKSLPSVLSCFGVGLVFVPSLPKTVYGAIRWFDNKPLIQISDRGHDLVSCWFTLFHEFGHAMKHKNVEIYEGGINESKAQQNQIEKDANKFANKYLFNGDNLRKAVFDRKRAGKFMSAKELAEEFNVQPIFASYWLLKAQYAPAFQSRIQIDFTSQYQ